MLARRFICRALLAAAATAAVPACGLEQSATPGEGPLAIFGGPPSGDEARTVGSIVMTEECVMLDGDGTRSLLVWPSEGTTWDPRSRSIIYDDGTTTLEIADGDRFESGGGGGDPRESGMSPSQWISSRDGWVVEPDAACLDEIDGWWFVGALPPGPGG